jgi:hypothetical protein
MSPTLRKEPTPPIGTACRVRFLGVGVGQPTPPNPGVIGRGSLVGTFPIIRNFKQSGGLK